MDRLNLTNITTVTYPEIYMMLLTALALVGCHNYMLWKNKRDWIRISFAVLLMSLANIVTRYLCMNIVDILLTNVLVYILVSWKVVRVEWYKAAIGVIISMMFISALELLYVPILMAVFNIDSTQIFSSNLLRFLFSLPERLIQLSVVCVLVRKRIILVNLNKLDEMSKSSKYKLTVTVSLMYGTMYFIAKFASIFMFNKIFLSDMKTAISSTFGFIIIFSFVIIEAVNLYRVGNEAESERQMHYISRL